MDADDFQDLYKLLRGSRCATAVLDARALFVERKLERSLLKMSEARASFAESRHRVLRQDPEKTIDTKAEDRDRQIKKAKRKQEKAQETLNAFDELLPVLTKMAQREVGRREREVATEQTLAAADKPTPEQSATQVVKAAASQRDDFGVDSYSDFDSVSEGPLPKATNEVYSAVSNDAKRPAAAPDFSLHFLTEFAVRRGDAKLDLVGGQFGFRPVENELDVVGDGVYLIQTSKRTMLVSLPVETCEDDELRLFDLIERKRVKPITRVAFLDLGLRRKMVLLTCSELNEGGAQISDELVGGKIMDTPLNSNSAEIMVDHRTAMNDPGTVLDDSGTVLDDPGTVLNDPGTVLNDPGTVLDD